MATVELSKDNFEQTIVGNDMVIVDFWAPWCGPCKAFAPAFQQVAAQLAGEFVFVKVNTEEAQQLGADFNIRSIPTLAVLKGGAEIKRMSGALPADRFVQWLRS